MTVLENVVAPLRGFRWRPAQRRRRERRGGRARRGAARLRRHEALRRRSRRGALSFGQQKLVELAQILMLDPKLILLDEPAGGINPTLIERMGEMIRELNAQGTTFLIVEHNMPFVLGLCDPVLVLARGKTIACGAPGRDPARPEGARRLPRRRLRARRAGGGEGLMLLRLNGVIAGYGGGDVLQGVDLEIAAGLDRLHRRPERRRQVDRAARRSAACCARARARSMLDGDRAAPAQPGADPRRRRLAGPAVRRAVPEHHGARERADGRLHHPPRPRAREAPLRRGRGAVPGRRRARRRQGAATSPAASGGWSSSRAR